MPAFNLHYFRRQSSAVTKQNPQSKKLLNEETHQSSGISQTANNFNQTQKSQRIAIRTQSRDKKTSVDPYKNLITQVQRSDQVPAAAPVVALPKTQNGHKKQYTHIQQLKNSNSNNANQQISQAIPEGQGLLGTRSKQNAHKKTLVLDLDETLVHSSFKPPEQPDIVLPVEIEGKVCYVYVLIRPGAITFLEQLAEYYELVIYTASLSKYAEPLMNILDQGEWCSHHLFREHCTFYNGIFVKDMTQLGRRMQDIIIIDNSPSSYLFQPENALPILSWYDDKEDQLLYQYIPMLKELSDVDDVRPFIMASVKDNILDIDKAMQLLKAYKDQQEQNMLKSSKLISSISSSGVAGIGVATSSTTTENQSENNGSVTNSQKQLPGPNSNSIVGMKIQETQVKKGEQKSPNKNLSKTQRVITGISQTVKQDKDRKVIANPVINQRDGTSSAKRFIASAKQKLKIEPTGHLLQNNAQDQNNAIKKLKRPLTTSKDSKTQAIDKSNKQLSDIGQPSANLQRKQIQVVSQQLQIETENSQMQITDIQDFPSSESTPQQTPDLEHPANQINKIMLSGPVQLVNCSQKKKLISEIATNQSSSLTREQIIQMRNLKKQQFQPDQINFINQKQKTNQSQQNKTTIQDYVETGLTTNNDVARNGKISSLNKRSNRIANMQNGSSTSNNSNHVNLHHQNNNNNNQQTSAMRPKPSININEQSPFRARGSQAGMENGIVMPQSSAYSQSAKNQSAQREHQMIKSQSQMSSQTPSKQSALSTRHRESHCDIPGEDGVIQKVYNSQTESSINRTPKSEINQPGKLFEKSGTRGNSSTNQITHNSSNKKIDDNSLSHTQPKIMNFNSRFNNNGNFSKGKPNNADQQQQQFTNLLRQKIDFKNIDINDSSQQNFNSQLSPTNNTLSIFKINSPKNNIVGSVHQSQQQNKTQTDHLRQYSTNAMNLNNSNQSQHLLHKSHVQEEENQQQSSIIMMHHKAQLSSQIRNADKQNNNYSQRIGAINRINNNTHQYHGQNVNGNHSNIHQSTINSNNIQL
ncbi:nuclear lim interactor-interacting [Stylonychia lemnae]|uniref:Nuclear lim interactor-interacting n=1 Tax=Stylonychia lemnae TaxID=5949 RepID=A0A078AN16_STYLE|nr:nuclear lim interactor-interacting [Stylonychia lemnae]|eukprot:CDW83760.1 nuclear lim interactor-interacting [Stylonychia lemnae]